MCRRSCTLFFGWTEPLKRVWTILFSSLWFNEKLLLYFQCLYLLLWLYVYMFKPLILIMLMKCCNVIIHGRDVIGAERRSRIFRFIWCFSAEDLFCVSSCFLGSVQRILLTRLPKLMPVKSELHSFKDHSCSFVQGPVEASPVGGAWAKLQSESLNVTLREMS